MSEKIYRYLLALYPRRFRQEYGAAAVELFRDRMRAERGFLARTRLWLDVVRDAAISIPQEYQRAEYRLAATAPQGLHDAPFFYTSESFIPRRSALLNGGILSIALFSGVAFLMHHTGYHDVLLVGSYHPSPSHISPAHTEAVPTGDSPTEVKVKPHPYEPPLSVYFRLILVLGALDTDRDGVISEAEIANASAALRTLDKNHDGKLTAEECGLRLPDRPGMDPRFLNRSRRGFMRLHPVLAALDTDHDGEISAREIWTAAGGASDSRSERRRPPHRG